MLQRGSELLRLWESAIVNYPATVAKIFNVWREHARSIHCLWILKANVASAQKFTSRRPPKCIASRWGSFFTCESVLAAMPSKTMAEVFMAASSSKTRKLAKEYKEETDVEKAIEAMMSIDEIGREDRDDYKEKVSKWLSGATAGLNCDIFWMVLRISHRVGNVIDEFSNFLQSHDKRVKAGKPGCLAALAAGKADYFHAKLSELAVRRSAWGGALQEDDDLPCGIRAK
eukprot:9194511-Pyramimonas_sp.AAC.1